MADPLLKSIQKRAGQTIGARPKKVASREDSTASSTWITDPENETAQTANLTWN
jgi:hypothetical protein